MREERKDLRLEHLNSTSPVDFSQNDLTWNCAWSNQEVLFLLFHKTYGCFVTKRVEEFKNIKRPKMYKVSFLTLKISSELKLEKPLDAVAQKRKSCNSFWVLSD